MSDFVGGVQARRMPALQVVLVSQLIGLCGLIVVLAAHGAGPPDLVRLWPAAAGGVAGAIALAGFYHALAIGTMSIVAPISATGVAVPVIVGVAGGDRPAALQMAGILAATVGVVLATRDRRPGDIAGRRTGASVALALLAALGFGSYLVGTRYSARADVLWTLLASRGAGVVGLGVLTAARSQARLGAARPALWTLAVIGALDVAGTALFAIASRHGLLSVVAVAASLYPLGTVLLARALLGERVRRIQEVGIAAALTGVVLIGVG